jgi:ribosomal protein S18 acetylase RimI-like enzyme
VIDRVPPAELFNIREACASDENRISDICVRTSDAGNDGRKNYSDPEYPGLIWAVPYLRFAPAFARVLTCNEAVVGYAIGTPDTVAFANQLKARWWPDQRSRYAQRKAQTADDAYVLNYMSHPEELPAWIASHFPAHVHINLLPQAQGHGMGRILLEEVLSSLRDAGASGVHLGINSRNEAVTDFYRKLGFDEIARLPSIVMAKSLDATLHS